MQKPSRTKRNIVIVTVVLVVVAAIAGGAYWYMTRNKAVSSYAECIAAGNPIMESYPSQCSTPDGKHFRDPAAVTTLDGTPVCLPHKNSDGPQTLECAVGLKTDDGIFYGISGDKSNSLSSAAGSDKKVRITGTLEPSTDTIYDIEQIITISQVEFLD